MERQATGIAARAHADFDALAAVDVFGPGAGRMNH
jgi:hypothetical protein